MSGAPTDDNALLFRAGVDQVLAPFIERGDITIVMDRAVTDWDTEVARRIVLEALDQEGGALDAIVAPNDGTAGGAAQALAERGLAGKIPITGHDGDAKAADRILAGTQGMTVLKDTRLLGREALRMAVRMARNASLDDVPGVRRRNNGATEVPMVLIEPVLVDAANIQKELHDSGYLSKERTAIKEVEEWLDAAP
jgi:D-xylose transport system substrate-binding protein